MTIWMFFVVQQLKQYSGRYEEAVAAQFDKQRQLEEAVTKIQELEMSLQWVGNCHINAFDVVIFDFLVISVCG